MINWLKGISQKWFLLALCFLAIIGCLLGIYLFENDFFDKAANKKNEEKAVIEPKKEEISSFSSFISEEKINKLIASLSLEEKVGQMFLVGMTEKEITPQWKEFLLNKHIGGVFLPAGNLVSLEKTRNLTSRLQKIGTNKEIPLFIAVSQEGDLLKNMAGTVFPGNMAVGATKSADYAYSFGKITGQELKGLGINLNLAPVLDLATNKASPIVGNRSFGEDTELVSLLGTRYISGLQNAGVAATAKSFPGLGEAVSNPWQSLPIISLSKEEIEKREVLTFSKAIEHNVAAIMLGNALFPDIDPRYPASISDKFLTGILRSKQNLCFEGVLITGDLSSKPIADAPGTAPAAVQAVKAGADLLFISQKMFEQENAYNAVLKAVQNGEIKEKQINAAVKRILKMKFHYALAYPDKQAKLYSQIASSSHVGVARKIGQNAITIVKNEENILPLPKKEKMLLLTFEEGEKVDYLGDLLANYYPKLERQNIGLYEENEKKLLINKLERFSYIIIVIHNAANKDALLVNKILSLPDKKVIVLALGNPYDLAFFPKIKNYLVAYSNSNPSLEGLVRVLLGQVKEDLGTLPITLSIKGD